jgi:hypothetical protein
MWAGPVITEWHGPLWIGPVRVSRPVQDRASLNSAGPTWRIGVIEALQFAALAVSRQRCCGSLPKNADWTGWGSRTLLAWLAHLALDGDLARAEPKTLRYRILHTAARLTSGGRRRHLKIAAAWPWATAITTAWTRISALPQAP